eukprot:CAMPEP_0196998202 /NCGR_PEP_ID=MMETSP1380-20130617/3640_1 /TAXON_ID=5936 /ORGANISM="Euplotes crassus, Strain CT5" /LENGTH=113 /DNA_ID=CAMNT_0042414677 /DNA_START=14 /DNA_END=355 /DNA_ORIENTATION=+
METVEDFSKEKDAAKSMLKLVEESIQEQKEKKERVKSSLCPSSNWNAVRKGIKKGTLVPEKKKKKEKPKKKKKRNAKADSKEAENKGGPIVEQVFYPQKFSNSKALTPIVAVD